MNQQIYLFIWFIFNFWIGCPFFFFSVGWRLFSTFLFHIKYSSENIWFHATSRKKRPEILPSMKIVDVYLCRLSLFFLFSIRRKVIYGVNENEWYHRKYISIAQAFSMIQLNFRYGFYILHWKKLPNTVPFRKLCYKWSI